VLSLAKKLALKVHLSTQASVSNFKSLEWFAKQGVSRIVLARECTLEQIKKIINQIRKKSIKCEIETFIHGAMCVSLSGRCFLSQYSFKKSANRGECIQPCRREYLIKDKQEGEEYLLGEDYVLSPKDLCTIDFIDDLIESGISSFKIEGRIRSSEYVKIVTESYRQAIDAFFAGKLNKPLKEKLKAKLGSVYNRGFSSGFYFGQSKDAVSRRLEQTCEKIYLGEVKKFFKKISVAEIELQNAGLEKGEELLFSGKSTPAQFCVAKELQVDRQFVDFAKKGSFVGVKLPFYVKPNDKVFIWRKK